ncbi:sperm-associated antigen 16 protein-like [Rhynchonycteris naso]
MAAQQGRLASPLAALEEALGMDLIAGDAADAVATEGTYYLEQVTIAEASEDECEYEEIPDDNFSVPEGEEDLTKAMQMAQAQLTDTQILEQKIVLPSKPVVPEAIEDFLCNFLIKMGMTRTLDCFQSEWYELMQKGVTELKDAENIPDVYTQLMQLETEKQNLKEELKQYKQAADKAGEDLLKTQKERDHHRMRHGEVVQERNKLINDLKGLKLHYESYEPTMRVLLEKHQTLQKQKMLTSLQRDRAVEQLFLVIKRKVHQNGILRKFFQKPGKKPNGSEFLTYEHLCEDKYGPAKYDYKLKTILRLHELPVSCICMHPREDILISCGEDHIWKAVEVHSGKVLLTGTGHTDWLSSCCFHPSGNKLATSSGDTTVKLWDMSKGNCILTFEGHKQAVWSCTWSSCDDIVASSSLDNTSKIWDVNSGRYKYTLYGHTESVNSIEFFPDSNTLLTGSTDKSLSIWDARTGKCEQSLYGHMHSINDATFTPRGHIIASCDSCGVVKLWDFQKLLPIVSVDVGPSPVNEVNFDPSGQVLAQASGSGIIHLLDLKSGKIHKLVGHENEVHTAVFSQCGESLFSGDADGTVRIWS